MAEKGQIPLDGVYWTAVMTLLPGFLAVGGVAERRNAGNGPAPQNTDAERACAEAECALKAFAAEFARAERQGDIAFLEQSLASGFAAFGPWGRALSKGQWLERVRAGEFPQCACGWDDVLARVYGDAGLATGRKITIDEGGMRRAWRVVLSFVNPGDWRIASVHLSPIGGAAFFPSKTENCMSGSA